jgi:vacuolar-type H+-ATPase subunit E/Vma4
MSDSDLSAALRRRAEEHAEAILAEADAAVRQIEEDSERAIAQRRSAVLSSRESEYEAAARSEVATERRRATRAVLEARAKLVDRVLRRAEALIPELTQESQYRQSLGAEVEQCIEFIGARGAIIQSSPALEEPIRAALRDAAGASLEPTMKDAHGFLATGEGGVVRIDGTLEARVRRLAPLLAIEITKQLGGD